MIDNSDEFIYTQRRNKLRIALESLILKLPYRVKVQNAVYVWTMIYVVLYKKVNFYA